MVKINETEAILSKDELCTLIGAATASILTSCHMSMKLKTLITLCAAEIHQVIESHVWGTEKIPEKAMDLTQRMIRIYETDDPEPQMEDKQAICRLLLAALQKTRAYHDLCGPEI